MAIALSVDLLAEIGAAVTGGSHGNKTDIVKHYAGKNGISPSTLYRQLNRAGLINGTDRPRAPVRPEYRQWVVIAKQLALKVPKGVRPVSLWMAMRQAVMDGLVPEKAMQVADGTFNRIAREMGLQEQPQKTRTLTTTHPMRYVQLDASTSEHFSIVKRLDDGDYLLRLHTRPNIDGYKNKPLMKDRLRPVVYAIWDMYSGYQLARYTAAMGENAEDSADFLLWACGTDKDDRFPFCGVPEHLWSDQGPLFKSASSRDLLDRLGIILETGEPYDKTRMGGVERTHSERWSWERSFFMRLEKGQHFEITLSALNQALWDYLAEIVNERASRCHSGMSRRNAWVSGVNRMGGVVQIPPDAMATLAIAHRRKVRAGMFVFFYKEYEVDGIGLGEVSILTDTTLTPQVVRNLDTGKQHTFRYRGPVMVGEEFRGIKETPRDKLAKIAHELVGQNPLFGDGENLPENVISIPARVLPAKPLFNPLADELNYASVDEAMAAFAAAYQLPMSQEHRTMVRELVSKDTSKKYIADLASRLINAATTPDLRIVQ